jgi:hypothetical protein
LPQFDAPIIAYFCCKISKSRFAAVWTRFFKRLALFLGQKWGFWGCLGFMQKKIKNFMDRAEKRGMLARGSAWFAAV